MKTAIVVPTYNRSALVARMLGSLSQCSFPDDVEVIVVENGKRSGTEAVCRSISLDGRVRYLFVEQSGRSRAMNKGMEHTDADFFIFFDDDLTFMPSIVRQYVEAAHRYGPGHFFGGPLVADAEVACAPHLVPHLPSSCKDWSMSHDGATISLSDELLFFGANWAAFRSDLARAGKFSEKVGVSSSKLSPVGEETLIQREMLKLGMRGIYLQEAGIYHLVPKECYTAQWIQNRKTRHGITDYILDMQKSEKVRSLFGVPTWVLFALVKEYIRGAKAALLFASLEQRTAISMRISYLRGVLYGAFLI